MLGRKAAVTGGCAAIVAACAGLAIGQVTYTPIALSDRTDAFGPNLDGHQGAKFLGFGNSSVINNFGQVLFGGNANDTSDPPLAQAEGGPGGLWLYSGGANINLAAARGPALGGGVYDARYGGSLQWYWGFGQINLNDNADYTFRESSGGNNPSRIFSSAGSTPGQLASTNQSTAPYTDAGTAGAAVGVPGGLYSSFSTSPNQYLNSAGQMLFFGSMVTGQGGVVLATSSGAWIGKPGSVSLLARQGEDTSIAPNTPGLKVYLGSQYSVWGSSAGFNGLGKMIGLADLSGSVTTGASAGNDQALLSNRNVAAGSPVSLWETIARRGDAPKDGNGNALADGTQFRSIAATSAINNAGRVAFTSTLRGGSIPSSDTSFGALFSDTTGKMKMYARKGDPLPASTGLAGLNWGGYYGSVLINHGGTVVFELSSGLTDADLNSPPSIGANFVNDGGLFKIAPDGTVTTLIRRGPAVVGDPGESAPVVQNVPLKPGEFIRWNDFNGVAINALGQVAFTAQIYSNLGSGDGTPGSGGSLDPNQRQGLFVMDTSGGIHLIYQPHTLFQVAPGDVRMISGFNVGFSSSGGEDGHPIQLNDNGDVVFGLTFDITPGNSNATATTSGMFIAHVVNPNVTCCRGTTCLSIPGGTCTGVYAGSQSTIVGSCGPNNQISTCCYGDYDHSGTSTVNDIFIYLNAWFSNSPYAKVGGDGIAWPSVSDIFQFLNAWFGGCT